MGSFARYQYERRRHRMLFGEMPIMTCPICEYELFYDDYVFDLDGEYVCEECWQKHVEKDIRHALDERDIEEPDWDSMDD